MTARGPVGAFNAAQRKLLAHISAGAPVVAMMGGWGVGKSRSICQIAQHLAETRPGCRMGIVGITLGDLDPFLEEALSVAHPNKGMLARIGWTFVRGGTGGIRRDRLVSPPYKGRRAVLYLLHYKRAKGAALAANTIDGPDLDAIFIEEANKFPDDEVSRAAWGRVRSGRPPLMVLLGKPTPGAWWLRYAEQAGGVAFRAPSRINRPFLPDYDRWVEAMSERERLENLDCIPQAPLGAVYAGWEQRPYPDGNLTPLDWTPDRIRGCQTDVALDFGARFPAGLVISRDPDLDAWIIWSEAQPDGTGGGIAVVDLCRQLMRGIPSIGAPGVWPLHRMHQVPAEGLPRVALTGAVGDRSGANTRDDAALSSAIGDVALPPVAGGLGMVMRQGHDTPSGERRDIIAGVRLVQRLICNGAGRRRLLCWHRLWEWGDAAEGRTLRKCLLGYRWATGSGGDIPLKDGTHDHAMDALRYWAVLREWPVDVPLLGVRRHRDDGGWRMPYAGDSAR